MLKDLDAERRAVEDALRGHKTDMDLVKRRLQLAERHYEQVSRQVGTAKEDRHA